MLAQFFLEFLGSSHPGKLHSLKVIYTIYLLVHPLSIYENWSIFNCKDWDFVFESNLPYAYHQLLFLMNLLIKLAIEIIYASSRNASSVHVAQWTTHSLLANVTGVQSPWVIVVVFEWVWCLAARTHGLSPGTPASSHINDPLVLTSVPTGDIYML